jgi:hypothetical protein
MGRPKNIHTSSNRGLGLDTNAKSGYKGVYFHAGKYMATIQHKGVPYYLGRFSTAEEAHKAYEAKSLELWGDRAIPCAKCACTWKTKRKDLCNECKEKRCLKNRGWLSTSKQRFANLTRGAKQRGLECTITLEEYEKISDGACFYCNWAFGSRPATGHGIDRLDNNKGYIIDNIVPCCWNCNALKQDMLTPEETKAAVRAILAVRAQAAQAAQEVLQEKLALNADHRQ